MKPQHSTPRYPNINYEFRPSTYWQHETVLGVLLRNVKGTERRKLIEAAWKLRDIEEVPEELLQDILSPETREALGRIHPAFMGGEYLPDYTEDETEIARIELESTTSDVISIRARRHGELIVYRIVDEYDYKYDVQRERSSQPLSLQELVEFIDGSRHPGVFDEGLALCFNFMNSGGIRRKRVRYFTQVGSDIYPQLEEHYERVFDAWVEADKFPSRKAASP
jgi:hypothetical protein